MVRELEMTIGEAMWNHIILGFSHWAYDQLSIDVRNRTYVLIRLSKCCYAILIHIILEGKMKLGN